MKRYLTQLATALFALVALACSGTAVRALDSIPVWPDCAPGEPADTPKPVYWFIDPETRTSDACVVICPGGGYMGLGPQGCEGLEIANYFKAKGIPSVVLTYRVPRREGWPKHLAAWQDAQRMIRIVRSRAEEWKIDPDKIGAMGFSAGGHLTLMLATSSQTNAYEPIDELDKLPCNVNFAIPVYPAYVLEDGVDNYNTNDGFDSPFVGEFAFDDKTPPMCMIHGDADRFSAMGSVAVYSKLRQMGVPAEMHIFAGAEHVFMQHDAPNTRDWLDRVYAWMKSMKYCE